MTELVTNHLSPDMQHFYAEEARRQAVGVLDAVSVLNQSGGDGYFGPEVVDAAVGVLSGFEIGRATEPGFVEFGVPRVPLYLPLAGLGVVEAVASTRWPVVGSPNAFGMRPSDEANRANQAAFYAMNGMTTNNMVFANTGTNAGNVVVIESQQDLTNPDGHRIVPGDGTASGAVIMMQPKRLGKGITGTNADNPIGLGAVYGEDGELAAQVFVNLGWKNIENGVAENVGETLRELGLGRATVLFSIGPAARHGFAVRRTGLHHRYNLSAIDREPNDDPEKTNLELTHAAELALSELATSGEVQTLDVCTVEGGKAGHLHSSRVERTAPTPKVPDAMAGGDRGLTAILPPVDNRNL